MFRCMSDSAIVFFILQFIRCARCIWLGYGKKLMCGSGCRNGNAKL